ncbi:hypothetical protein IG7_05440 [Bacillus cereus HuA2-4]|nr:hypothetical protein IG7_05440 [Bacillus cereus HuA2-4]
MKIWELKSGLDNYESYQLLNLNTDYKRFFEGEIDSAVKMSDSWGEILVKYAEEGKYTDFPKFWGEVGTPMVSRKAKELLEPLISNNVEFLPLIHADTGETYYIINILNTIDAIDYDKAVLKKLRSGLAVNFKKYAFLPDLVENQKIFKVYLNQTLFITTVFASDELKNLIQQSDLTGFEFVEVWDLEEGA